MSAPDPHPEHDELLAQLGWMRALALRLVRDPDVADDVLQRACLLALQQSPDHVRTGERLRAWLASVTRRTVGHAWRGERRRSRREQVAARPEALPATVDLAARREILRRLVEAVTALDEPFFSTLVRRYYEGLSTIEIAAQDGVSAEVVRQRLTRARRELRGRLEQTLQGGWLPLLGVAHPPAHPFLQVLLMAEQSARPFIVKTVGAIVVALLCVTAWLMVRTAPGAHVDVVSSASTPGIPAAPAATSFALAAPGSEPAATPLVDPPPAVDSQAHKPGGDLTSASVRVVVVDQSAVPVPGATVQALPNPNRETDRPMEPLGTWTTDAAGRCTLRPPVDDTWLFASKTGTGCSDIGDVTALQREGTSQGDVVLRLLPPARLRGIVVEPDDRPAVGVAVRFWAFGGSQFRVPDEVVTGQDGRFDIEVDAGTMLAMRAEDGARLGQEFRYRTEPRGDREVQLRLPGDWTVAGIVFDRHSVPVAGATVTLWRNMPDQALPAEQRPEFEQNSWSEKALTGGDGRFCFPVRERLTYTVIARVGIELPTSAALAVIDEHQDHAWLELRLPEPSFVAGQVMRADGTPADGVTLTTSTGDSVSPYKQLFAPQHTDLYGADSSATTGPDGRFRIEGLHPDAIYSLRIASTTAGHAEPLAGVHAGTADVHIQLIDGPIPASSVVFDVVSARDGRPIAEPEIHVMHHIENFFMDARVKSETLPDGRRRLSGFSVGETYSVWIVAPDHAALDLPRWTSAGGEQERRVELPQPAYLDVQVSLPDGSPAAWADVRMFPFPTMPRFNRFGAYRRAVDAEGHVSFGPFDPGPVRVRVLAGGTEVQRDLVIGDGAHERLELVLSR